MRVIVALVLSSVLSATAGSQVPRGRPLPRDDDGRAAVLVDVQLSDTSFIERSVALNLLSRESDVVRRAAAKLLAARLSDARSAVRSRALSGLQTLGAAAEPVIFSLISVASDPHDGLRLGAIAALGRLRSANVAAVASLQQAARDSGEAVRLVAADALLEIGDSASARTIYRRAVESDSPWSRLRAARALARLSDASAVSVLRAFLADSNFTMWSEAAIGLGLLGPKASSALPELVAMVSDTVLRRIPQGRAAWQLESRAPYAAWALSRILPFRTSGGGGAVLEPVHAVVDSGRSLRGDGLGVYAWGVDSVAVWQGSGFFLMLSPSVLGARGPVGPELTGLRRSLLFDLSDPVPATGARSLGVIRDHEAYVWVWYRRDPASDRVSSFRELGVSESTHDVGRIEMHFRVNGILHVLQMGPFVEGQGGGAAWNTGLHGEGTSLGRLVHPAHDVWIVSAPTGSIARLWSFEDRSVPVDRGLYRFSLQLRFIGLPGGPAGACVPTPSTCAARRP